MRSMPMVFMLLLVIVSSQAADDWQINKDVVDLAVAIHQYDFTLARYHPVASLLVRMVERMATRLSLSETKTRMAIVDFGKEARILLPIEAGIETKKVVDAVKKVETGDYTGYRSAFKVPELGKKTREMIFTSNDAARAHVPKLVLVFIVVRTTEALGLSGEVEEGISEEGVQVVSLIFDLERIHSHNFNHFRVHFPIIYKPSSSVLFDHYPPVYEGDNVLFSNLALMVVERLQMGLGLCAFKVRECGENCLPKTTYDLALSNGSESVYPAEWKRVELYCFKSVPCLCSTTTAEITTAGPVDETPIAGPVDEITTAGPLDEITTASPVDKSTTSEVEEGTEAADDLPDPNAYYPDDPLVIGIRITTIVFGCVLIVAMPLAIYCHFWAKREWKRLDELEKANKAREEAIVAAKLMGWTQMQASKAQWSISQVPDVTLTPVSQVVKQLGKKKM